MRSKILFVSGSAPDARRLSRMLHSLPVVLEHADGVQPALAKLRDDQYDVIFTEAALPDGDWLDILQLARESSSGTTEVIVTDPQADARFWSEALNLGAFDLVAQPFHEPEVRRILYNACVRAHAPIHQHAAAV